MPNVFKSGTTFTNGCIYKGQFVIGVDTTVDFGPTSATSFWNGVVPASGGYTIYQNKAANGPSIRTAADNSALVTTMLSLGSTGSTAAQVLDWASQQSNIMVANIDYESIVPKTNRLAYAYDAGWVSSYPTTGNVWRNMGFERGSFNGTLTNGPTFSSASGGTIVFDGTNDYVDFGSSVNIGTTGSWTISCWWRANGAQSDFSSIIQRGFTLSTADGMWAFKVKNASNQNFFSFSYTTSGGSIVDVVSSAACNDGNWHNLVITRETTSCIMYMDGTSVGTFTLPANQTFRTTSLNNCTVGYTPRDSSYIKGNLANLFIYINVALSAAEVSQNYNAQKGRFGL